MDRFDNTDDLEPDVRKALAIARNWDLPFTARGLTRDDLIDERRRTIPWWLVGYGLFAALIFLLAVGSAGGLAGGVLSGAIALPILIAFGFGIRRAAHDWASKPGRGDVQLSVEVGADGIIVHGSDGDFGMRWTEIEAGLIHADPEEETGFAGVVFDSPLGRVKLSDSHFADGRAAAALIVRGMHDDHVRREREKVERIA